MRIFLSAIVCFLLSFAAGNSFSTEEGKIMLSVTVSAQGGPGQCPQCITPCFLIGLDLDGYLVFYQFELE